MKVLTITTNTSV